MGLSQLLTLVGLNVVGMLTPGPDIFLVTRIATKSRRHAYATVAGIATGLLVWVTLTVFGATAVLTAYPSVLSGIQLVGGAWLLWMGTKLVRVARRQRGEGVAVASTIDALLGTPAQCYRQGLATNLSNPKVVLYFAAIIAPFLPTNPSLLTALSVIVVIVLSNLVMFSLLATVISTNALRRAFLKAGPWIDLVAGCFFIIAGIGLIIAATRS
ncbi:LysE family translocator [Corynebacterium diphtheriae]|nr:LysE family translocator [Corynebacterium diphtheriae]CAB1042694.1 LysE family translocator [Corynebacterium diphtheriae]